MCKTNALLFDFHPSLNLKQKILVTGIRYLFSTGLRKKNSQ